MPGSPEIHSRWKSVHSLSETPALAANTAGELLTIEDMDRNGSPFTLKSLHETRHVGIELRSYRMLKTQLLTVHWVTDAHLRAWYYM